VREYESETILIVVNLSRYSQHVELDLQEYAGSVPMEVFSRNDFRVISDQPWGFSMQFKNYFWFELKKPGKDETVNAEPNKVPIELSENEWQKMEIALQLEIKERLYKHFSSGVRVYSASTAANGKKNKGHFNYWRYHDKF